MKVYIFGAGASKGSQTGELRDDQKAPLVDEIFNGAYAHYAEDVYARRWLVAKLKKEIGDNSLEEWLTKKWVELGSKKSKEALASGYKEFGEIALYIWRLMARISDTYSDDNGYALLLDKLAQEDEDSEKAYINFNYDLLLDRALNRVYGYNLSNTIDSYTTYNYLKPHGSINWFVKKRDSDRDINEEDLNRLEVLFARMMGQMHTGKAIPGNYTVLDPSSSSIQDTSSLFNIFGRGQYAFPLVMLPLTAKMYDLVDGFLDRMRAEITRIMPQATDIYIIGYRARDSLIDEILRGAPLGTKLHVVGNGGAKSIQSRLIKQMPGTLSKGTVNDFGFTKWVKGL